MSPKRGRTAPSAARTDAPGPGAALAIGGLILALALAHIVSLWFVCDDAFISFRYAANLARGLGLVYNPGERVEGYSNFLWTIVSALVIRAGGKPEVWAPVLSTICALGTLAVLMTVMVRRRAHPAAVGLLLAANTGFAAWSTSGLETALYTLLMTAGVVATMEAMRGGEAGDAGSPATNARLLLIGSMLLGLASLTRPDGLLVSGLVGLFLLITAVRGRLPIGLWLTWAGLWLACVAPHVLWRYSYYGRLLPNSSAVKTPGLGMVVHGAQYLGNAAIDLHLYLFAALAAVGLWARRAGALGRRDLALAATVLVPYLAYVCTTGGDFMPLYRFVAPLLPLLALVTASTIAGASAVAARAMIARVLVGVLMVVYLGLNLHGTRRHQDLWVKGELTSIGWARADTDHWRRVGEMLRSMATPNDTLATTAAGAIPYVSELVTIDLLGVAAPHLERFRRRGTTDRPGHRLIMAEAWIDRARPQILLGHPLVLPTQKGIGLSLDLEGGWRERIMEHYQLVGFALPGEPPRYVACALRNDVAQRMIEARSRAGR